MKKVLYFIPVILILILCVFIVFIGGLSFDDNAWLYLVLPLIAGVLVSYKQWWGCLFGLIIGAMIIYSSTLDGKHIINELPIGIIWCAYYVIMGYVCYKSKVKE